MRVLIIDDDRALRDALRRALSLAGYEIDTAAGGEAGLAQIAEERPDAVVLDIGLGGMTGWRRAGCYEPAATASRC